MNKVRPKRPERSSIIMKHQNKSIRILALILALSMVPDPAAVVLAHDEMNPMEEGANVNSAPTVQVQAIESSPDSSAFANNISYEVHTSNDWMAHSGTVLTHSETEEEGPAPIRLSGYVKPLFERLSDSQNHDDAIPPMDALMSDEADDESAEEEMTEEEMIEIEEEAEESTSTEMFAQVVVNNGQVGQGIFAQMRGGNNLQGGNLGEQLGNIGWRIGQIWANLQVRNSLTRRERMRQRAWARGWCDGRGYQSRNCY